MRAKTKTARSPYCCFKPCNEPKAPGRQCCVGHLEFYDRMRVEVAKPVASSVVRRDRVTALDHDPDAAAMAERGIEREDLYLSTRRGGSHGEAE